MKTASVVGILLIVIGVIALVSGGISYTKNKDAADIGPIHVQVQEKKTLPLPPVIGVVCLVGGIVLVAAGSRRRA